MPQFLSTRKDQKLREKYADYCLKAILTGEEAKPFEEFQRGVLGELGENLVAQLQVGQCQQAHGLSQVGSGQRTERMILNLKHGRLGR